MTKAQLRRCQQDAIARMRLERAAVQVHRLGPRVLLELALEIGRHNGCEADAAARLTAYSEALTPEMVALVGADRFPSRKPFLVSSQ